MKGYVQCERSGRLVKPCDIIEEHTGARVAREVADITPGFGTWHPQDVNAAEVGGDPTPIDNARPQTEDSRCHYSDAEVLAAIKEDRPPRRGY